MRLRRATGWALLASLLLAGCATQPPADEAAAEPAEEEQAKPSAEDSGEPDEGDATPTTVSVTFETDPAGGTVRLVESAREIEFGESIALAPGTYTVEAEADGYRPRRTEVRISADRSRPVTVELGEGYGTLALELATPGTSVTLAGEADPRPLTFEDGDRRTLTLDTGEYVIRAGRDGYHPLRERVQIEPGSNIERTIELREKPRTTPVSVRTDPAGAKLWLDGAPQGSAKADLGRLPFGEYRLEAVHTVDARHRLTGSLRIELRARQPRTIELKLEQRERLFAGEWLPEAEARQREQQRYARQRVANPGAITLVLDRAARESLLAQDDLASRLHARLRVGDRLRIRHGDSTVVFWKRHRAVAPMFEQAAAALAEGQAYTPDVSADEPAFEARVEAGDAPIWQALYRLHRGRAAHALIDLSTGPLSSSGAQIARARDDGALTLLARTEQPIRIDGTAAQSTDGLVHKRIEAADAPVRLQWQQRPRHLLLVSDRAMPGVHQPQGGFLKLGEKKLVRLLKGPRVERLHRLSSGPAYDGWQRKSLDRSGPMGDEIDLNRDEIGPHQKPGDYARVWLIRFAEGGDDTQRQVQVRYTARRQEADFTTDNFIRREQQSTEP